MIVVTSQLMQAQSEVEIIQKSSYKSEQQL